MQALIVIAHGSRRQASNDEVRELTLKVRAFLEDEYDIVEAAFLELAEPDIPSVLRSCVECGAASITVVPYFLAAGTHVVNDIPKIITEAAREFPDVAINIRPHIGASSMMIELIARGHCNG